MDDIFKGRRGRGFLLVLLLFASRGFLHDLSEPTRHPYWKQALAFAGLLWLLHQAYLAFWRGR